MPVALAVAFATALSLVLHFSVAVALVFDLALALVFAVKTAGAMCSESRTSARVPSQASTIETCSPLYKRTGGSVAGNGGGGGRDTLEAEGGFQKMGSTRLERGG